ncbi:hypothetical protein REC12_10600 [Desulfosporosinus sp. PR]|uniref:hypothetical protein n=1 Tax=Candidatus Desulfosporosinus nitrosoreducens TaxID=3401928 RepID=UPI0027E6BACA|nr:hypothetical protein [Desulfosporosinus sp. PR]MDQ7094038.1 hypothetical protein [Desulfosporosinus sp. PR]
MKRKTRLALIIMVISVALVSSLKLLANIPVHYALDPNDVIGITMKGGLPGFSAKVLFPAQDTAKIAKVVQLINSSSMTSYVVGNDYVTRFLAGLLHHFENEQVYSFGHPIYLTIELKDSRVIQLSTLSEIQSRKLPNGETEVTGTPYNDRILLVVESNDKTTDACRVFSKELANYVAQGWRNDMLQ